MIENSDRGKFGRINKDKVRSLSIYLVGVVVFILLSKTIYGDNGIDYLPPNPHGEDYCVIFWRKSNVIATSGKALFLAWLLGAQAICLFGLFCIFDRPTIRYVGSVVIFIAPIFGPHLTVCSHLAEWNT